MKSNLILFIIAFYSLPAFASNVQIGQASYAGTGCPAGSLELNNDLDKLAVQVRILQPITAEAGRRTQLPFDRKDCSITVPIQVEKGFQVAVAPVKFSGEVAQPGEAMSQMDVNYYYQYSNGADRQSYGIKWPGIQYSQFSVYAPKNTNAAPFWSRCGFGINLQMNVGVQTQSSTMSMPSILALGQIEGFEILVRRCTQ
jgi:hypothetical protein